ncbi:hypothetical protein VaNZ11_016231 [Volvox africanus]|uniref:Uncharacterized protein n=1 Tax=Volvox africanus TaxID=51714 RepID=A0ABQ5SP09_9CHLO|nr:hypothetical protein VaNZ11_016231 [Volvox africanus]
MLSGAPSRSCPGVIPHGGTLLPISSGSSISNPQLCGQLRPCRSRPASELALQFTCSTPLQHPHRKHTSRRHPGIVWVHERQPGPQEDGCGCQGLPGIQHDTQPSPTTTPQQPFADTLSSPAPHSPFTPLHPQSSLQPPSSPHGASTSLPDLSGGVRGSETGPHTTLETGDCPDAATAGEQQSGSTTNIHGNNIVRSSSFVKSGSSSGSTCRTSASEEAPLTAVPGDTSSPLRLDPTSLPGRVESGGGTSGSGDVHSAHLAAEPLRPHPEEAHAGGNRQHPSRTPSCLPPSQQQQQEEQDVSDGGSNSNGEPSEKQHPRFRSSSSSPASDKPQPQDAPGDMVETAPREVPAESLGVGDSGPGAGAGAGAGAGPGLGSAPLPGVSPGLMGSSQLPPLLLGFLNWSQLQVSGWGESGTGSSSTSNRGGSGPMGRSPQLPRGGSGGAPRRRRGGAAASAEGGSRGDRILQAVLAAKTLLQVRAVISRHFNDMSASTASVALGRLAGLTLATMRLRRAQQQPTQPEPPKGQPPLPQSQEMAVLTGRGRGSGEEERQRIQELESRLDRGDEDETSKETAEKRDETTATTVSSTSSDKTSLAAAAAAAGAPGRAAVAGGGAASADVDADGSADPSARVQQGSLRLMRMLLRHIALCVDTGAGHSGGSGGGAAAAVGPAGTRGRGSGSDLFASSSSPLPPPSPSSARPPSTARGPQRPRTSAASSSSSWSRLPAHEHRARLAGNVFVTLARVGLKPGPSDLWALYRLVEAARPDLFLASPQQLSRLASSLPLLGPLRPSPPWMDHFAAVSRSKMYAAEPGQLAAFVWCMARLGHNPGELWLHSLTHHLNRDDNLQAATAGQLCQILWALHRLEFMPNPDWRADCTAAVQAALTTAVASPDAASRRPSRHTAAARGREGIRRYDRVDKQDSEEDELYDSSSSVDEFEPDLEAAVGPRAPAGGAGGGTAAIMGARRYGGIHADMASLLLWAVRMGMAPGPAGMQICLDQLLPALRSLRRVYLLRLVLALAEADYRPSEAFMARLLACLQPKLPLLGPTQLTQLLVAISRLRFVPPQSWLVAFLKASRPQLRHYNPALVAATYQVFAGWQLRPSRPYLQSLHSLLDSLIPEFTPQGLAAVLQSMSTLGIKPQHRWLARALVVLTEAAARNATGVVPPTHGSVLGLDAAASSAPSTVTSSSKSGGLASRVPPTSTVEGAAATSGQSFQRQQQQTLRQQQRSAAAAVVVTAVCSLRGIVQFEGERPPRLGSAVAAEAEAGLHAASPAETGTATEEDASQQGVAGGGDRSGSSSTHGRESKVVATADSSELLLPYELWSSTKQLTDLCGELLDVMSGPDLAKVLTALSRMNFYPGRYFLAAHARATARAGAQLAPADKEALATCYSRLAALAPRMAEEARRKAEVRQARSAVIVADPWVR